MISRMPYVMASFLLFQAAVSISIQKNANHKLVSFHPVHSIYESAVNKRNELFHLSSGKNKKCMDGSPMLSKSSPYTGDLVWSICLDKFSDNGKIVFPLSSRDAVAYVGITTDIDNPSLAYQFFDTKDGLVHQDGPSEPRVLLAVNKKSMYGNICTALNEKDFHGKPGKFPIRIMYEFGNLKIRGYPSDIMIPLPFGSHLFYYECKPSSRGTCVCVTKAHSHMDKKDVYFLEYDPAAGAFSKSALLPFLDPKVSFSFSRIFFSQTKDQETWISSTLFDPSDPAAMKNILVSKFNDGALLPTVRHTITVSGGAKFGYNSIVISFGKQVIVGTEVLRVGDGSGLVKIDGKFDILIPKDKLSHLLLLGLDPSSGRVSQVFQETLDGFFIERPIAGLHVTSDGTLIVRGQFASNEKKDVLFPFISFPKMFCYNPFGRSECCWNPHDLDPEVCQYLCKSENMQERICNLACSPKMNCATD